MTSNPPPALLGRERTIAGAVGSIEQRGHRRLVIYGRAGVGKTALAVAVGERLGAGAVLVDVNGAADAHEVYIRLGRALDVTDAGAGIRSAATAELDRHRAVLVLDDCNDWPTVGPVAEELLDRCDELVVLLTTRDNNAAGTDDAVIHLHPLPLPPLHDHDEEALGRNPAVRLFVNRAQEVNPAFEPSSDDLRAIAELCRRLDGLPLAVKLAASRISLMQPDALLREMRRVGAWQLVGLSLEDEFSRTVEHLDDAARRAFLALDTFVGGASVDALHAVTGLAELADTIDALSMLVALDLVTVDRVLARYSLSSAAAAFVRDTLADAAQQAVLRDRHADHFARSAREPAHPTEGRSIAIDHGNRLAAAAWLRDAGAHARALGLLVDMAGDFDRRGEPDKGRQLLTTALANAPDADARTRARAHLWIARFVAESPGPVDRRLAIDHLLTARSLAEISAHEPTIFLVLFTICENHTLLVSSDLASDAIADGLDRAGGGHHPKAEVGFLTWKAVVTHQHGDEAGAAAVIADAIGKGVALDDHELIVRACLVFLGLPADVRARVVTDSPSPRRLLEMTRAEGDHRSEGWLLALVTGTAIDDGDRVQAAAWCRELLALALERSNAPLGRLGLVGTVRLATTPDDARLAARITGALDRHEPAVRASMAPHSYSSYRRAVDALANQLGPSAYARLHRQGSLEDWHDLSTEADRFLRAVVHGSDPPPHGPPAHVDRLSPRELDVLGGLVGGRSNKDIAAELGMRPKTVMHHCAAIYRKLGVPGRAGAVAVALRTGLVSGEVDSHPGHAGRGSDR